MTGQRGGSRRLLIAGAIVASVAAGATAVGVRIAAPAAGPAVLPPGDVGLTLDEHEANDVDFPGSRPDPRRPNRVRRGDADAVRRFKRVRPRGALTAIAALGNPARGSFSPPFDWPLVGIHTVLTPDGRVLSYGTSDKGLKTGYYIYDVWDPKRGLEAGSHHVLPNTSLVDIFCNAQLLLPNGRIEMWGGDTTSLSGGYSLLKANDDSNVYDPLDDSLKRTGRMNRIRWYATATTLPTGEVYIQGGSDGESPYGGGKDFPEVRTATGQFRLLNGASTDYLNALYPRNFLAPDGKVFGVHYSQMYRVDPTGIGTLTKVGKYRSTDIGGTSTAVMFRPGRILQTGGGLDANYASREAHVIDIRPQLPTIAAIARPAAGRHWGHATVLADGRVFLSGGSTADNVATNGVAYTAEIYDPGTDTWSPAATAQRMRLYHSSALLLPDATVLTVGGGANGPELNLNGEIYYPPYLFNPDGTAAARPVIDSVPMTQPPARSFAVATRDAADIARVTLVKTGSDTHSVNMDQRFIELPFQREGDTLLAQLPANPYDTPPGFYLVFVFNGPGVPSEAMPMRIDPVGGDAAPPPPPPPTTPSPGTLTVRNVVVNNDGGTARPEDFRFIVDGGAPVAFEADGENVLSLAAGLHSVTAPALAGYATTTSGCTGIDLPAGGSATCTITNDDVAAAPPPAPGNLLVNGDFETNDVADGSAALLTRLAGWNNKAGPIELWRNYLGYAAGQGSSWIEVDGAPGTIRNRVYQNVATAAGAAYELSFLYSPRPGNAAASNRFDVYWNGTRIYRLSPEGLGLTGTRWTRVTLSVTGTGGSDRVSFFESDAETDDRGVLIDDVRLVRK